MFSKAIWAQVAPEKHQNGCANSNSNIEVERLVGLIETNLLFELTIFTFFGFVDLGNSAVINALDCDEGLKTLSEP